MGKPGNAIEITRTVAVEMNDTMRLIPARIEVKQGETIRITARNTGKVRHELVLGTSK